MNALRTRILTQLLLLGAVPLTLFTLGVRFLPGGVLPWLWYALVLVVTAVAALIMSGRISTPLKQAISAFRGLVNPGQVDLSKRWVPAEFWAVREELKGMIKEVKSRNADLEADAAKQQRTMKAAERAAVRSLEVLHGLVEAMKEGVIFIHDSGHVALINGAMDSIFPSVACELEPGVDGLAWLRKAATGFTSGAALATQWEAWHNGPPAVMEGEWVTATMPPRVVAVKTFGIRGDEGENLGRVWHFTDVTSERHVNQRLQDSQKLESIGQLAGGIAHDFNNLLTAIRGSLALAQLEGVDGRQRHEHLENATRAASRATDLVGQILGYSRGKTAASRTKVKTLVMEVHNLLRASLDPRVLLRCNVDAEEWLADIPHVQLEQVLLNLCFNARDAIGERSGSVDIFTSHFSQTQQAQSDDRRRGLPGDYVVIHVRDTGSGIPEDVQDRLFEPFFTTKEPGKGTGLGLATSHAIVNEAGGWMEFDSVVGDGTEFRVFLPRALPLPPTGPLSEPLSTREVKRPQKGTADGLILVVDDESSVRSIAVNMLKYLGYRVVEAADGEQALEHLAGMHAHVDAILLDVHMPRISGKETYRRIRARGYHTPVIVCSGFTVDADEFKAFGGDRKGSLAVIQKPYSIEKLAKVVSKAVEQSHHALSA